MKSDKSIEELFSQLLTKGLGGFMNGGQLKPPVVVTERYIGENYHSRQVLDISDAPYDYVSSDLDIETIKVIIIQECDLKKIPNWVYQFSNLEGLLVDRNPELTIDCTKLSYLKELKVLGLLYTNIHEYGFLEKLKSLECLDVSGNSLKKYPSEICSLDNLIYLDISTYNTYKIIPECIKNNSKLRVLRAHYGEIESLPNIFNYLPDLQQLILGANHIESIPTSVYELSNLIELDLFNNNIEKINFKALSKIEVLEEIFLAQNPIEDFPTDLLEQKKGVISSHALRKYFETGVYFEISKGRSNDSLQTGRLLRSARSIIFRGLFLGLRQDWSQAYTFVKAGYYLSRDLNNNKLAILAGVFLGYLELIKETSPSIDDYMRGAEWSNEIDGFWKPYEDKKYRELYNASLFKYSLLSQQSIGNNYTEEQDFDLLLAEIFDSEFDAIKISEDDELSHVMLRSIGVNNVGSGLSGDMSNIQGNNELNNRDLIRGLLEVNLVDEAWREVARQHCINKQVKEISPRAPKHKGDANIYIFQLTNRDKIRVLIIDHQNRNSLIKLDSISISLNSITVSLMQDGVFTQAKELLSNEEPELLDYTKVFKNQTTEGKPIEQAIWDTVFGAYILSINTDNQGETVYTDTPTTFHEYCQSQKLKSLNIFPYASLLGIPFYIGHNVQEDTYVLEHYNIINRPPFIVSNSGDAKETELAHLGAIIAVHEDLEYAKAEADIIKSIYTNSYVITNTSKSEVLASFEVNHIIHLACHAKFGVINLNISGKDILISPEEIRSLDLSNCKLVFLNACKTSEEPFGSLINRHSLPLSFLEAGAKAVISTTREIHDSDAFRISVMLHQQIQERMNQIPEVFSELLLDCKNETLPFFEDKLEAYGYETLGSHMKYMKKYGDNNSKDSWKYYTIWESNDEQ